MTSCQISGCSVRLNQGLLPTWSTNVNSSYIGKCHVTQNLILFVRLSLKGITRGGGGQGGDHKVRGWAKSMLVAPGSYLVWEGACMETCTRRWPGATRRRAPRRMLPMIECLYHHTFILSWLSCDSLSRIEQYNHSCTTIDTFRSFFF